MTPQQRLQEAKDQAARECGWLSWESAEQGNFESSADKDDESQILHRAAEIMYEAGKKEAFADHSQPNKWIAIEYERALKVAETFRKALKDIAVEISGINDDKTLRISNILNHALGVKQSKSDEMSYEDYLDKIADHATRNGNV